MFTMRAFLFVLCLSLGLVACTSSSDKTTEISVVNKLDGSLKVTCSDVGGSSWKQPVTVKEGGNATFTCGLEKRAKNLSYGLLAMQLKKDDVTYTISPRKQSKTCKITVDYIEYNQPKMKIVVSDLSKVDNVDVQCQ